MRVFCTLAIAAASFLLLAHQVSAQEPVRQIGVLLNGQYAEGEQAVREGLHASGYDVGRNVQIEYRITQGQPDRVPALVADLVALRAEIILASGPQNSIAAHAAAPNIPLVFIGVADPIRIGLVPNLARPGGDVTGTATNVPDDFVSKQVELLKEAVPAASRIAILINPTNEVHQGLLPTFPEVGRRLGVELIIVEASRDEQIEPAFQTANSKGAEAILVQGDGVTFRASAKIVSLAAQYRLPAIYLFRAHVKDGGLMSYGPNLVDLWRSAAVLAGKILKGEKPGDLPVARPTKYDLVINLKTAKALGLTIPPTLLATADEVIE
jgi:putative ABC transport system substrate-binding protein